MHFSEYQRKASETDQAPLVGPPPTVDPDSIIIPLLGMAGEAGGLLTEYKKFLRDGDAYPVFTKRVEEELGDMLWYMSNLATKSGLAMEDIAEHNLAKIADRWTVPQVPLFGVKLFDDEYPADQQFPRKFEVQIAAIGDHDGKEHVELKMNGEPLGDPLRDNAYEDDGYRFHDVFHLSYVAVLGWSPVIRKLMGKKRRDAALVDENEDGGRAQVIDEAISAFVFSEASRNNFFENVDSIDYSIIRMIKQLTSHLEVRKSSGKEWENAILSGFKVWREVKKYKGGVIRCDLRKQQIEFLPLQKSRTL